MQKNRFFILFLSLIIFSSVDAVSAESDSTKMDVPRQFAVKDISELPECKYVVDAMITRGIKPPDRLSKKIWLKIHAFFDNVQNINLYFSFPFHERTVIKKTWFLRQAQIENLAACVLQKKIANFQAGFLGQGVSINIHDSNVLNRHNNWSNTDTENPENLSIFLYLEVRRFPKISEDKILLLHLRYYRVKANEDDAIEHQCSDAFPFSTDDDKLLQLLTNAMLACQLGASSGPYITSDPR